MDILFYWFMLLYLAIFLAVACFIVDKYIDYRIKKLEKEESNNVAYKV